MLLLLLLLMLLLLLSQILVITLGQIRETVVQLKKKFWQVFFFCISNCKVAFLIRNLS